MAQQPDGMTNTTGVIMTFGMVCSNERFAYVMPLATNNTALALDNQCKDAVVSAIVGILDDLMNMHSVDCYCAFVQATGMTPGYIPWRTAFISTDHPGTDTGAALPTNVSALGIIYQDPADEGIGAGRIRQARTFFTAMAGNRINNNELTTTYAGFVFDFMTELQAGWVSDNDGAKKWYRVLDVPKPTSTTVAVKRLLVPDARGGVYTQKRRLVPRVS